MTRLQLNKSALSSESKKLRDYRQFLPSLDLKRQQLLAQRNLARQVVKDIQTQIEQTQQWVADAIPMLAYPDIQVEDLVSLGQVTIETENLVGTSLPVLKTVEINTKPYSKMSLPHWVDNVVTALGKMLELSMQSKVAERRLAMLNQAVNTITQRVNLFEKVLIPKTTANIKRIKIYLSDEQMAAVVRSKIAKRKRLGEVAQ